MEAFVVPVSIISSFTHPLVKNTSQLCTTVHRRNRARPNKPSTLITSCTSQQQQPSEEEDEKKCPSSSDTLPFEELFLKGPVPGDRLVRTISASGEVSCRAVTCTGLVNGAARLHKTTPIVTTAFGRALTSALLLASGKKDGEQLQIEIRGSGPINGLTVIANGFGEVRGYVGNPNVNLPLNKNGKFDVPKAIGKGILAVVRSSSVTMKNPYTGLVNIYSGEVVEDIAMYLTDSEQTPSALAAGVYIEVDESVGAAAGFLVQLLPGASEKTIAIMERNVRNVGTPTEFVKAGKSADDVVAELMKDLNPLNIASVSPRYRCKCGKDRVKRTVGLIPSDEIRDLLEKQGKIEAICEFCGQVYNLLPDEVEILLQGQQAQQRNNSSSDDDNTNQQEIEK